MKRQKLQLQHAPGTRFGLVTVVGPAASAGKGCRFRVRCDCGAERDALGSSLRQRPPRTHRLCKWAWNSGLIAKWRREAAALRHHATSPRVGLLDGRRVRSGTMARATALEECATSLQRSMYRRAARAFRKGAP